MKRLPIILVGLFLVALYLSGCSDEDMARTERVLRAGANAYYGQPAQTGYYVQPAPAVYPYAE